MRELFIMPDIDSPSPHSLVTHGRFKMFDDNLFAYNTSDGKIHGSALVGGDRFLMVFQTPNVTQRTISDLNYASKSAGNKDVGSKIGAVLLFEDEIGKMITRRQMMEMARSVPVYVLKAPALTKEQRQGEVESKTGTVLQVVGGAATAVGGYNTYAELTDNAQTHEDAPVNPSRRKFLLQSIGLLLGGMAAVAGSSSFKAHSEDLGRNEGFTRPLEKKVDVRHAAIALSLHAFRNHPELNKFENALVISSHDLVGQEISRSISNIPYEIERYRPEREAEENKRLEE